MRPTRYLFVPMIALVCLLVGCGNRIKEGTGFATNGEFEEAAGKSGYVLLGQFNESFPATITSVVESKDSITIDVPGHGRNEYSGFDGYKLKAVVLKRDDGQFMGVVLRSEEK